MHFPFVTDNPTAYLRDGYSIGAVGHYVDLDESDNDLFHFCQVVYVGSRYQHHNKGDRRPLFLFIKAHDCDDDEKICRDFLGSSGPGEPAPGPELPPEPDPMPDQESDQQPDQESDQESDQQPDQESDQQPDQESDQESNDVTFRVEDPRVEYAKDWIKEFVRRAEEEVVLQGGLAIVGSIIAGPPGAAIGYTIGKGVSNLKTAWEAGAMVGDKVSDKIINDILINSNDPIDSGEGFSRLAETLYIHHEALQNGSISLDQAFSGQRFSLPFNLSQASAEDQVSSPRRFNALFTGGVDFTNFSDSTPSLDFDGSTTAYGLGVTAFPNPDVPLLTGLQLGFTRSDSDFENTEADVKGSYKLEMFSVHPSIAWDATDNLTFWSVLGYGRPNTETTIDSIDGSDVDSTEDASYSSSGDFFSFAGGANYRVWQSDASALSINLSGSTASILDVDSQEGRIAAQFSHDFPLNSGQLSSSADLALLLSNSNPSVAELSGSLNWLPNQGRLSGSTNARVLLFGGDRSEWGIGGSILLQPGQQGQGLSLALQPSFGQTNASLSHLHLDPFSFTDPNEPALSSSPLTARFNAELAYGFPTANHALLTPYIDASLAHGSNTYTTGLRYQLDSGLNLDLSASHRQRSSGNNDSRLFLQLRSDL